jgi:DNA-binding NarL/FixJ family response regulator
MLLRPINLALVDDHSLFRKTLKAFLSEQKDLKVVIQVSDVFELFSKLKTSDVDVLILDVFMPELNGNVALKMIRTDYPAIKIVVLSMSTDMNLISDMLDFGIHGYISKADEPDELLRAITAASEGRLYRNKLLTEALYWNTQNNVSAAILNEPQASLNERDKKILQLIWEEKSNKEMADELFLGVRSVEKIRQDMKEKIGVKSTVGLLKYAIARKIINVDPRPPVHNALS